MKRTQVDKLLAFIANNPGCTGSDIFDATRILNYTARVSDARLRGHNVVCRPREDGRDGYWIVPQRIVDKGEPLALGL